MILFLSESIESVVGSPPVIPNMMVFLDMLVNL